MKFLKKVSIFLAFSFSALFQISGEGKKIDYYGIICSEADKNMTKMTEDLYYTQLKDLNISLTDKRNLANLSGINDPEKINYSISDNDSSVFFAVIKRNGDALSNYTCTIYVKELSNNSVYTYKKEYDSYYKILMESKASLSSIFNGLIQGQPVNDKKEIIAHTKPETPPKDAGTAPDISTENIAGSWSGEQNINKIVIMRGGRGFIIFKDGASMNIAVNITDDTITIKQTGHSNASFFTELNREDALEAAKIASPIEWTLSLDGDGTLSGKKRTIVKNQEELLSLDEIAVEWHKMN